MAKKTNSTNSINEILLEERCILNKVLKLTGKRWLPEILLSVENDVIRFSQLKTSLRGISDHVLSRNLNTLISSGLLTRKIYSEVPIKVEYQLSAKGKSLLALLHGFCSWGKEHIEI